VLTKDAADPKARRLNLVLEIKGEEDERDRAKAASARRWVEAVNYAAAFVIKLELAIRSKRAFSCLSTTDN
jgi:hypothetical protein